MSLTILCYGQHIRYRDRLKSIYTGHGFNLTMFRDFISNVEQERQGEFDYFIFSDLLILTHAFLRFIGLGKIPCPVSASAAY